MPNSFKKMVILHNYIKYLKLGRTVALVKYWTEGDRTYGCKTVCFDGDCDSKESSSCKFEVLCED